MNTRNATTKLGRVGLAVALCGSVFGQTPQADAAKEKTVERLAQQIGELQTQLKQIQEEMAREKAAAAAALAASDAAATAELEAAAASDSESHKLQPFQMRGFADMDFGQPWFEKLPDGHLKGSTHSFNIGDFDLFTTARLSSKLSFLTELLITSDFSNEFGAEIDRMMLNYKASDYLTVGIGKFNTAIGYYPENFHRAHYFQTATSRPVMFADEDNGGFLPVHSIGLTAGGRLPSGPLGLHWVAEVANGRAAQSLSHPGEVVDIQNFVDENNGKAINFELMMRPPSMRGLEIGASFYRDRLHPEPLAEMSQHILAGHVVFVRTNFEFLNEIAVITHAYVEDGRSWKTLTGYSQISKKFDRYRPYFRYDYQHAPKSEPLFSRFGPLSLNYGASVGIRYDIADYAGFKIQYGRLSQRGIGWANDFHLQFAFAF